MPPRLSLLTTLIMCVAVSHALAQQPESTGAYDACQAVQGDVLFKPLRDIKTSLPSDDRRLPPDCGLTFFQQQTAGGTPRSEVTTQFHWQATDFFSLPTYFDDVPLERYGQTMHPHLQPVASGVKFVLDLPAVPYKVGVDRPWDCISTLGHQPPGDCVPCIKQTLPLEADAVFFEAAVAAGMIFLLP